MGESTIAKSEHSFNNVKATGDRAAQGGGIPPHAKSSAVIPNVSERLHSHAHGHVCNHARCAARGALPCQVASPPPAPKKFLVAKKYAYGGLTEENKSSVSCGSSVHSLANSTVGKKPSWNGSFTKGRSAEEDRALYAHTNSMLQQKGPNSGSDNRKVVGVDRNARANSSPPVYGKSRKSGDHRQQQDQHIQQKSRLSCTGSLPSLTADQDRTGEWRESPSPKSCITTSVDTPMLIDSARCGEDEDGSASPTASVGSNHCTQIISKSKENVVIRESMMLEQLSVVESSSTSGGLDDSQSPASTSFSSQFKQSESVVTAEEMICNSPTPSVTSRPTGMSKSPTPSIASNPPRVPPRPAWATSAKASTNVVAPPSAATNLARKFITNLKESSRGSSTMSSSVQGSTKKSSRVSKSSSASPAPLDSSFALPPTAASTLARKFISDLQASTAARKSGSTPKGVRSIELKGGKAKTYCTTIVTSSWNMTTTIVETSAVTSISEKSIEKNLTDSELSSSGPPPPTVSTKPPWKTSTKKVPANMLGAPIASSPAVTKVSKERVAKKVQTPTKEGVAPISTSIANLDTQEVVAEEPAAPTIDEGAAPIDSSTAIAKLTKETVTKEVVPTKESEGAAQIASSTPIAKDTKEVVPTEEEGSAQFFSSTTVTKETAREEMAPMEEEAPAAPIASSTPIAKDTKEVVTEEVAPTKEEDVAPVSSSTEIAQVTKEVVTEEVDLTKEGVAAAIAIPVRKEMASKEEEAPAAPIANDTKELVTEEMAPTEEEDHAPPIASSTAIANVTKEVVTTEDVDLTKEKLTVKEILPQEVALAKVGEHAPVASSTAIANVTEEVVTEDVDLTKEEGAAPIENLVTEEIVPQEVTLAIEEGAAPVASSIEIDNVTKNVEDVDLTKEEGAATIEVTKEIVPEEVALTIEEDAAPVASSTAIPKVAMEAVKNLEEAPPEDVEAANFQKTKEVVTKMMAAPTKEEAASILKFGKKAITTLDEAHVENSTVSLKHGEVAERRLSEEWMTNHALEDVVKKIADKDHRVKVLVHAFETLATHLSDSEGHTSEDNSPMKPKPGFEALSATSIAA